MKKRTRYILISIGIILLGIIIYAIYYVNDYYKASYEVYEYLQSSDLVDVYKDGNMYIFDGYGKDNAIIFYQGGKVDNIAYSPLLYKLAENGIDCYLVNMPFRLAIFDKNKANRVINEYNYKNWYLMGHSLGGIAASMYVSRNKEKVKGLILLAAYSTDKIDDSIKVLSIYGSLDGVLNMNKYKSNKNNLGNNLKEVVIDGGNHSYFGYYGDQKGDNKASITREEQQNITINEIVTFVNE